MNVQMLISKINIKRLDQRIACLKSFGDLLP